MGRKLSPEEAKLDRVFSEYVRLKYADDNGYVSCYTCGKVMKWNEGMQNGHFWGREFFATRWDERNCRPQETNCNYFKQGMSFKFAEKLKQEYGEDIADQLELKAKTQRGPDKIQIQAMIEDYQAKVKELKKEKGQ